MSNQPVTSPIEGPTHPCDACPDEATIVLWSDQVPAYCRDLCFGCFADIVHARRAAPSPPLPVFESMHGDRTLDA